MSDKEMPKEVSIMGGCPVPSMCSPLLLLAELEAEGKAKKARLRAQQRGRVAKGKKGRFRAALRHLRSALGEVCRPRLRPHHPIQIYQVERIGKPGCTGEFDGTLRPLSPEEIKSGK